MRELSAGDARVVLQPELGGRIASLVVDGMELLVTEADRPIDWGLFPMAPFAGRLRDGTLSFDGRVTELPLTLPPHAIHGTLVTREWSLLDDNVMTVELAEPWPYRGVVTHEVSLGPEGLAARLTLEARDRMPAWLGWHPWLRRALQRGHRARLDLHAAAMFVRGDNGVPTGDLTSPPTGPWDDCFTEVAAQPSIVWPNALSLVIDTSCRYLVAFTEPEHALCVEPQTAPPDALNLGLAAVLEPDESLTATMNLRWRVLN